MQIRHLAVRYWVSSVAWWEYCSCKKKKKTLRTKKTFLQKKSSRAWNANVNFSTEQACKEESEQAAKQACIPSAVDSLYSFFANPLRVDSWSYEVHSATGKGPRQFCPPNTDWPIDLCILGRFPMCVCAPHAIMCLGWFFFFCPESRWL